MNRSHIRLAVASLVVVSGLFIALKTEACTRILWNDNGRCVLVGRNMDWFEDIKSNMWRLPRGMKRDGLVGPNSTAWTSRYGSVVLTAYDAASADGINEKGLAVHMLYLPETSTSSRDKSVPGLCISLWAQYYLDQFSTVAEAVEAFEKSPYQLVMTTEPISKQLVTVHLTLNDSSGDSAIIECINGKMKFYHDRKYTIMSNQPTFDKQLENLKKYRGFGGTAPLPGSTEPADRFVRGAYYASHLPKPKSDREAIASLMSVMRNVSAPFGISDPARPNVSTTLWRTVTDLTHKVLYFDNVLSPQVCWIDLNKLNFDAGQPVGKIKVEDNDDLAGDVSGDFKNAEMFPFLKP